MKKKLVWIIPAAFVSIITLVLSIAFMVMEIKTINMKSDYGYLKEDQTYSLKVEIDNLDLVKQHVSCGYATIEMMSAYYGSKVTEDELQTKNNGGVSTSSSNGFLKEINASIPNKAFVKHSYLKNDVLLKEIHDSLNNHNPVAIEWAAEYEGEWTLHFSLVSGLDIINDNVTVYNPYGYIENLKIGDFVNRTTFKAYKHFPLFLNFGFAFGAFEKNTIFFAK